MEWPVGSDLTKVSAATPRATHFFRGGYGLAYPPGTIVKLAAQDLQTYNDETTVVPSAAVASDVLIQGVVSEDFNGFTGAQPASYVSNANSNSRGTQGVKVTVWGYHPSMLIDQAGAGASALTNGAFIQSSPRTAGRGQGVAASVAGALVANAVLPTAGIGSNLSAGALAQASQTVTIAGAPAANDVITVNIQSTYDGSETNPNRPGVAVVRSIVTVLTAAQAANATSAAAAVVAMLNADPVFAKYYVASNAAGVITIAVNANAAPFLVSFANGGAMTISLSGSAGNGITLTAAAQGGSTAATGGGALAGGTGFFGTVPAFVAFS